MHLGYYFCFTWELKELTSPSFAGHANHSDIHINLITPFFLLVDAPGINQLFWSFSCNAKPLNILVNSDKVSISKVYFSTVSIY